jgi:rhodanese-related sulfurtransferase
MTVQGISIGHRALVQQGYDYSPEELRELEWGLRFTPLLCMAIALVGLATAQPAIHFALAALGILPFWFPAWHPLDRLYNHLLRPLWNGVRLPPNPLPRRIACFMGGSMNLAIGFSFLAGQPVVAYILGAMLITLQLIVITTHFCVASWMFEGLLRMIGKWLAPIPVEEARRLVESGGKLLDVRNPDEFARGHLPGAVNVPFESLERRLGELGGGCYLCYCMSGLRSQRAAQILKRKGFKDAHNLGAMARWK